MPMAGWDDAYSNPGGVPGQRVGMSGPDQYWEIMGSRPGFGGNYPSHNPVSAGMGMGDPLAAQRNPLLGRSMLLDDLERRRQMAGMGQAQMGLYGRSLAGPPMGTPMGPPPTMGMRPGMGPGGFLGRFGGYPGAGTPPGAPPMGQEGVPPAYGYGGRFGGPRGYGYGYGGRRPMRPFMGGRPLDASMTSASPAAPSGPYDPTLAAGAMPQAAPVAMDYSRFTGPTSRY